MARVFSTRFKISAVEQALARPNGMSIKDIARSLGVGHSTLERWMTKHLKHEFEGEAMAKAKRPQDWSKEEKLDAVIAFATQDEDGIDRLCREQGIFRHQVEQWKREFVIEQRVDRAQSEQAINTGLKTRVGQLERELRRKDKALAEAAALIMLQKKVDLLWRDDEDS